MTELSRGFAVGIVYFRIGITFFYTFTVWILSFWHLQAPKNVNPLMYFLNKGFIHAGWFISCFTIITLMIYKHYQFRRGTINFDSIVWTLANVYWFVLTRTFVFIAERFGDCSQATYRSLKECRISGGRWNGFDISGHCFLIVFASVLILEELLEITNFFTIRVEKPSSSRNRKCSTQSDSCNMKWISLCWWSCLVLVVWYILLVQTSLYYHTMAEKIIGTIFGLAFWWIACIIKHCRSST
jgi:hypothetical protein